MSISVHGVQSQMSCKRGFQGSVRIQALCSETSFKSGSAPRADWCGSFILESLSAPVLVSQSLMKSTNKIKHPTNARMPQESGFILRSSTPRKVRKKNPAKLRGLLSTCGALRRDPSELMLIRLANGWAGGCFRKRSWPCLGRSNLPWQTRCCSLTSRLWVRSFQSWQCQSWEHRCFARVRRCLRVQRL